VPALFIDGVTLFESLPIIQYLEETRPNFDLQLFGENLLEKTQILALCEMVKYKCNKVNAGIQPLLNLRTINKISEIS
jgi:glutathione S-transferase